MIRFVKYTERTRNPLDHAFLSTPLFFVYYNIDYLNKLIRNLNYLHEERQSQIYHFQFFRFG